MARLFIALPVDDDVKDVLKPAYQNLCIAKSILKVVDPENYHITLKFFGNCDDLLAAKIEDAFSSFGSGVGALPFTLSGLGTFPGIKRANVIWCSLQADKHLQEVYQTVEAFSEGFGFKAEKRSFKPHLTLARVRKGRHLTNAISGYIEKNRETSYCISSFKRLVLFSSRLTPEGPVYTEVVRINLSPHTPRRGA